MATRNELAGDESQELDVARADFLRRAGKAKDASVILEHVVNEYAALAGPTTPTALSLRNALASVWVEDASDPTRVEQATALVSDCEHVLGKDAATTISARDHLACLLAMQGEFDAAFDLHLRAVRDATRLLGEQTATSRHIRTNLAATLLSMGRPADAARELETLLASAPELDPGPECTRRTFRARRLLAICQLELGRTADARAVLERLAPEAAQLLGEDAALTVDVRGHLEDLRSYRGPVVTTRGGFPRPWVFVADGRASLAERFAAPQARPRREPTPVAQLGDELTADDVATGMSGDSACTDSDQPLTLGPVAKDQPGLLNCQGEGTPGIEVRVIGPVEVVGWHDPGGRATQLAEILSYLVFHRDRPVRASVLRLALRPDLDDEITEETLHAYVSMLRRAVGREVFPPASRNGYRLSDAVTSDWERFSAMSVPDASIPDLEQALQLVRGRPFSGVPEGSFRWVDAELLVSVIDAAVADAALRLSAAFQEAGDTERASWAVRQGLSCSPYDASLWRLHLSLAKARGPGALARARREADAALGEETPI